MPLRRIHQPSTRFPDQHFEGLAPFARHSGVAASRVCINMKKLCGTAARAEFEPRTPTPAGRGATNLGHKRNGRSAVTDVALHLAPRLTHLCQPCVFQRFNRPRTSGSRRRPSSNDGRTCDALPLPPQTSGPWSDPRTSNAALLGSQRCAHRTGNEQSSDLTSKQQPHANSRAPCRWTHL